MELVPFSGACILWRGAVAVSGYGVYSGRYAHRVIYEAVKGKIARGTTIGHLCRNRLCVNPNHLEAVPPHVNSHRGAKAILTESDVRVIRRLIRDRRKTTSEIAATYGVSPGTILSAATGRRWASVPDPVNPIRRLRKSKLTKQMVESILAMNTHALKEICGKFGISKGYASVILNRKYVSDSWL